MRAQPYLREKNKSKTRPDKRERRRKRKKRWIIAIGSVALFIIALHIALPFIILRYVNHVLANMEEYYGHVEDIDIHLYRGAYVIKDMKIMKKVKGEEGTATANTVTDTIPFFSSKRIDLSVEWRALFKGSVVGEIDVIRPVVNFVKEQQKGDTELKSDTADFRQLIKDLMPLKINRFTVKDGEIHYLDPSAKPSVDIYAHNINIVATNLTNVERDDDPLPAKMTATATVYDGRLSMTVKIAPFAGDPTFDLDAELTEINLVNLNPFFQAYANLDVEKGTLGVYTEFAAKEGKFGGYVKPLIKDLDIVEWSKDEGNIGQILWEAFADFVANIFKNQKKDQVATKVVLEGQFDKPGINVWRAIGLILRNAFIEAIRPSIDETININNLREEEDKTLLEKIFGGKKDKKKKKKNRQKNKN